MQNEIKTPFPISPQLKALAKQRWGTIEERFWRKVLKDGPIQPRCPELGPCWQWVGARASGRYGSFWFRGFRMPAHRVSWIMHYGEIPEGLEVMHKCDYEPCVCPKHLKLGTHQENAADASQKGKFNSRKGEQNAHHKLTEAQVRDIRSRYRAGNCTQWALAIEYGVKQSIIQCIISYRNWTHI